MKMKWVGNRRAISVAFGLAMGILALIFAFSYRSTTVLIESGNSRQHSHRVLEMTQRLLSELQDAETGQRGYLITGAEPYLEPYHAGVSQVAITMKALRSLVSDDIDQKAALPALDSLTAAKFAELQQTIELRRKAGFEAASQVVQTNAGKQIMDDIRRLIDGMNDRAEKSINHDKQIMEAASRRSIQVELLGGAAAMALLLSTFFLLRNEIEVRTIAEVKINLLNEGLKQGAAELEVSNIELGAFNKKLEAEIAGRKLAEEELRRNEERLSLAVGAGQMGVWELDVVNDTSIRSARHDEIFGYPTLQPKWGYEIFMTHVVPDDREGVKESFEKGIASGQLNIECRIRRNDDNSVRWISAQGRQIRNEKNEPVRMSGVITDITERKRAEEGIRRLNTDLERRTADLEIANKELEAFTYSVAHDLRAPLRHIDGFSKMLMEEDSAALSDEAKRYLNRIRQGTSHMGQLVDDLLNLARLGRQELSLQVTGLSSLVEDVLKDLKAENLDREIRWSIQPLPFVECDPGLMRQVFSNLLSNALKYTRPRKNTSIEVSQVTGNGENIILIRDNGVGFSMKYADKLFGVFQRLHRQEDFEGTGVGLATVQRIIRKHGGRVWAQAELDKGATFYFTLGKQKPEGGNVSETGSVRTVESEQKVA
ncbi:MAG TPA: CHASE3 domain-containing protein [Terriglobia bacterium]|nr:CHASE3 domain-containing protein [Terriglobia bacterium]